MNYSESLNQLNEEQRKQFYILADFLVTRGWQADMSQKAFAKLLSDKTHCQVPSATAERRLRKFQELGLIELQSHGKGNVASTIILKSYTYQGSLMTGIVPLDSPLYIQREADDLCQEALSIAQDGDALPFIRIKAAQGMGKSSLLARLGNFLETEQKQVVGYVDLASDAFYRELFTDLDRLFYQFTAELTQTFQQAVPGLNPPSMESFWKKPRAPGKNCTDYLHEHIFKKIKQPKTLLIDGIDQILGQTTQTDFLLVLRSWNERKMKVVSKAPIVWPSMVIAYSTEPYPDHKLKGSPMQNVGMAVELQEFSTEAILALAKIYGLSWTENEVNTLMRLIGGHPTLIHRAFYQLSKEGKSLAELEQQAAQLNGAFSDYLLKYLNLLQKDEQLLACFSKIIKGGECTDVFAKFQLEKVGLIKSDHQGEKVRCELYQRYFQKNL
ncbi:MAG: hypothetical protein F6J86_23715 [Symploca sp. SIO1B1]|nr:hypothetical protein [Symploca sp. SIO1B1]